MLYPTINELTKGQFNRYELSLATAKCARIVTDEYVQQRTEAENALSGSKDSGHALSTMIDRELCDNKAVKTAIRRIHEGEYVIVKCKEEEPEAEVDAEIEAEAQADTQAVAED